MQSSDDSCVKAGLTFVLLSLQVYVLKLMIYHCIQQTIKEKVWTNIETVVFLNLKVFVKLLVVKLRTTRTETILYVIFQRF